MKKRIIKIEKLNIVLPDNLKPISEEIILRDRAVQMRRKFILQELDSEQFITPDHSHCYGYMDWEKIKKEIAWKKDKIKFLLSEVVLIFKKIYGNQNKNKRTEISSERGQSMPRKEWSKLLCKVS